MSTFNTYSAELFLDSNGKSLQTVVADPAFPRVPTPMGALTYYLAMEMKKILTKFYYVDPPLDCPQRLVCSQ